MEKEARKKARAEMKAWAAENLIGVIATHQEIRQPVGFNATGIREFINQPYKHEAAKPEILKTLVFRVRSATYSGYREHADNPMIAKSHILQTEVEGEASWLVLREYVTGEVVFYSISDGYKIAEGLKKE